MENTEKRLRALFDFQRFAGNERLDALIRAARETAERAGVSYANARFLQHQALKKPQTYLTE